MKVERFQVEHFRSIKNAEIAISDCTVLIGPNNEGKSNLLHALSTALTIIRYHGTEEDEWVESDDAVFSWERDFPINLQKKKSGAGTCWMRIDFCLNEEEVQNFKEQLSISVNSSLPIEIVVGKDDRPVVKVVKPGKGAAGFTKKSAEIARFIGERLSLTYIPAVRTEEDSMSEINSMLQRELRKLEKDPQYKSAIQIIEGLQTPVLQRISQEVTTVLAQFLPQIKHAQISIPSKARFRALRSTATFVVDDGTATSLARKGDGIKSLAAIGLMQTIDTRRKGANILAIEEPESHLHSGAVRKLRDLLYSFAPERQVILSTHSPVLVNTDRLKSNILVRNNKAAPAESIAQIRDALGVLASDNLLNASMVLLVEGEDDCIALDALLRTLKPTLVSALSSRQLVIEPAHGASKIPYLASLYNASLYPFYVFVDGDEAGRGAIAELRKRKMVTEADYTILQCSGMTVCELEDAFDPAIYVALVKQNYGVDLTMEPKTARGKKWSDRAAACFAHYGKVWDDAQEVSLKVAVAKAVAANPEASLWSSKGNTVNLMLDAVETKFLSLRN